MWWHFPILSQCLPRSLLTQTCWAALERIRT